MENPFFQFVSVSALLLFLFTLSSCNQCSSRGLKFVYGDALTDSPDCIGKNGQAYPRYFYLTGTALMGFKLAMYLPWL
jgi:hypothetical protein